ncbi:MAG: BMP family ABC transporter substrate-binding protein [Anaerolineales bacterium]
MNVPLIYPKFKVVTNLQEIIMAEGIIKKVIIGLPLIFSLAGCGLINNEQAPQVEAPAMNNQDREVICLVTDTQGINDRSFNATAWKGVIDAERELSIEKAFLESQDDSFYAINIDTFIQGGCNLIVTVGYLIGEDTAEAAVEYPEQKFAIVDYDFYDFSTDPPTDVSFPNVRELTFETDEAAFMAGYVAAAVTKTGKVGTFGGVKIPTVTIFMDGFALGVSYYNQQHGTDVVTLGWDPELRTGLFTDTFDDVQKGVEVTELLVDEGADIIMPVAGGVGLGAAAVAGDRDDILIIGVDSDWTVSVPEQADSVLTSVLKNIDVAVFDTIESVQDDTFQGGLYIGTLENNGVGLAPFGSYADLVPDEVKSDLEQIRSDIISGAIQTQP